MLFKIITFWFFVLFAVLINGYLMDGTTTVSTDKCSIIISITKDKGKIESSNYPKPYPTNCMWTYTIHIGVGYKLKLNINDIDVDIESGDALIIEPTTGSRVEIENHSRSKQLPITKESVSEDKAHSAVITFLATDHPKNTHRGFSINFERIEEPNTEKPNENELPGWIQLYLAGVSAFEFNLIQDHFKEATAKITKEYIDMKHISNENLTEIENDIIINSMEPCPSSWPWASSCIQLNFSIKLNDNSFELNSEHLKDVWDLHRSSEDFYRLGIMEYELPDVEWFIWFWIFLICFISLVFAFLLVIVVRTKLIHYYFLKLENPKPEAVTTRTIRNWQSPPLSYPFNAENSQRFQFARQYERHASHPTYSRHNGIDNVSYGRSEDAVDDFDSEDEQHIYHSLDYK